LLLGKLLHGIAQITTNSVAVFHSAEQVDLPGLLGLLQDLLRLLSQRDGENGVGLGGADAVWAFNCAKLLFRDE
jgi:hypothetical protein